MLPAAKIYSQKKLSSHKHELFEDLPESGRCLPFFLKVALPQSQKTAVLCIAPINLMQDIDDVPRLAAKIDAVLAGLSSFRGTMCFPEEGLAADFLQEKFNANFSDCHYKASHVQPRCYNLCAKDIDKNLLFELFFGTPEENAAQIQQMKDSVKKIRALFQEEKKLVHVLGSFEMSFL